jgi:hypothetical protein
MNPAPAQPVCLQRDGTALTLQVRVMPRAGRDVIEGVHDGRLRVRLAAAPVEGAANARLIAFLADCFGVPRARVTLLSGERGRDKRLRIESPTRMPGVLTCV